MAHTWFRFYAEFANDLKVQMLSEADQRRLTMLFCLRCGNGDVTLHDAQIAFQLRIDLSEWHSTKERFIEKGFINKANKLLNWDKRQFISDSSAPRVAAHRARKKQLGNVTCNVTETPKKHQQKVSVTPPDTDTDTEKEIYKENFGESEIVKAQAVSDLLKAPMGDTLEKEVWFQDWEKVWGNLWKGHGTARRFYYSLVNDAATRDLMLRQADAKVREYLLKKELGLMTTFFTPTSFLRDELWKDKIMTESEIRAEKAVKDDKIPFKKSLETDVEAERKRLAREKTQRERDLAERAEREKSDAEQVERRARWERDYPDLKKPNGCKMTVLNAWVVACMTRDSQNSSTDGVNFEDHG